MDGLITLICILILLSPLYVLSIVLASIVIHEAFGSVKGFIDFLRPSGKGDE